MLPPGIWYQVEILLDELEIYFNISLQYYASWRGKLEVDFQKGVES